MTAGARQDVAIVTGASQGIGLATVEAFLATGRRIVAMARDARRLVDATAGFGDRVVAVAGDVREEADVERVVAETMRRFGRLDVVVNAAGVSMSARTRLRDSKTAEWRKLIETNLTGTYLMCRACLPHLEAAPGGYIVNVQSTAAFRAGPGTSLYAATKFGVRALSEALVEEYRGTRVRISSVSPGPVDTAIWGHKTTPPTAEERARMLRARDIAGIVRWLVESPPHLHVPDILVTPWNPS